MSRKEKNKSAWSADLYWWSNNENKGLIFAGLNYFLFAIVFHFVILGLLEQTEMFSFLNDLSGFKKFLISAGVFYTIFYIHCIPKLYMIPSTIFSAMDAIILTAFIKSFIYSRFNIKIDEMSISSIAIFIICTLLLMLRYYHIRFGALLNYDVQEQSIENIEYKLKHDKWYRKNRIHWTAKQYGLENDKSFCDAVEQDILDKLNKK